jgi:threonine/homoserine/homoserine lactone efflux protein
MMTGAQSTEEPYVGDPIGPGLFANLRHASGTKRGRQALLLAAGIVVVVVVLVIGLVVFSSISRQSQSYKDGFSVGGAVYAADAAAQLGAQQACKNTEVRGPHHGGLPSGDNAAQWQKGCVAAFASAQGGN